MLRSMLCSAFSETSQLLCEDLQGPLLCLTITAKPLVDQSGLLRWLHHVGHGDSCPHHYSVDKEGLLPPWLSRQPSSLLTYPLAAILPLIFKAWKWEGLGEGVKLWGGNSLNPLEYLEASRKNPIPTILGTAWYHTNTAVHHVAAFQWCKLDLLLDKNCCQSVLYLTCSNLFDMISWRWLRLYDMEDESVSRR